MGPVSVPQSLILGAPNNNVWVSFTQGESATFGFGSAYSFDQIFVDLLANGAGETGAVYGRSSSGSAWVLLGSLSEPNVGAVGAAPNVETFSLSGAGLSQISDLKIVSNSSAGIFPGTDIQGLGGNLSSAATPEPCGWGLVTVGLPCMLWMIRRKASHG